MSRISSTTRRLEPCAGDGICTHLRFPKLVWNFCVPESFCGGLPLVLIEPQIQFSQREAAVSSAYGTNAFEIGRSPLTPNCWIRIPAVVRFENHVPVDGRKTVASYFPSPS